MNNYILINRTFCEITPGSAIDGDFSDHGFIEEKEQVTFSELVTLMREHNLPSCSPDKFNSTYTWYSTDFYISDYSEGIERQESIHFCEENTINAAKYWFLAAKIAAKKR